MDHNDIIGSLDPSSTLGEFIKSRKWQLVVEHSDRQIKKSDPSKCWKIIKIIALLSDARNARKDSGLHDLRDLLENKTVVTDPAALLLLENLAQSINHDDAISPLLSQVWERAAHTLSGDTSWLFKLWVQAKLVKGRYGDAKQATMAWMKAYPKDHDPFYLFILLNELITRLPNTSSTDVKLCGMLASKALATAASATDASSKVPGDRPGRTLASQDDLAILIEIYQGQNKFSEGLQILESPKTGLKSQLGKLSWPMMLRLLDLQGLCSNFEAQWILCYDTLRASRPDATNAVPNSKDNDFGSLGDDWRIWSTLVTSALTLSLSKPEFLARTEQLFVDFEKLKSRNAMLARMKMYAKLDGEADSAKLLTQCRAYFEKHSTKNACMRDTRPHLNGLLRSHQQAFIEEPSTTKRCETAESMKVKVDVADYVAEELNRLKLDYNLIVSRTTGENRSRSTSRLVQACLQLHQLSTKLELKLPSSDQGPADDALTLASMALIRLYHLGHRTAILRSIVILEHLLHHSKHNYEAMLILIKLYMYVGLGSLAVNRYARLSIKNIQHASISWILFPRISKIHPHPVKLTSGDASESIFDPKEEVNVALEWYRISGTMTNKAMDRATRQNQYPTMIGLLETQELLQAEVSRVILNIEKAHLSRSRDGATTTLRMMDVVQHKIHDSRDRSAFPSLEPIDQFPFEKYIPSVTPRLPQVHAHKSWLLHDLESEDVIDQILNPSEWNRRFDAAIKDNSLPQDLQNGLTSIEVESFALTLALKHIVSNASLPSVSSEAILAELEALAKRLIQMRNNFQNCSSNSGQHLGWLRIKEEQALPSWFAFHGAFTILSTITSIQNALSGIDKSKDLGEERRRVLRDKISTIDQECEDLRKEIESQAKAQRNLVKPTSFRDSLYQLVRGDADDIAGQAIVDVVGRDMMENTCSLLSESWVDAFDGIIKSSSKA